MASVIAFTIITVLHIILGELVPKALALLYPEEISGWVAAPLIGFAWVMSLPIALLNGTSNWLLRLMGINPPGETERLHSPEEIRMLVEQSTEGGSLLKQDARLLEGVFEFSEKTAQEVMTPRTQMVALEADLPVERAADAVAEAGRSRYPVYTDSLDEIVGVVHAEGHPGRAAVAAGKHGSADHASAALRPRHPRGGGRPGRHEAAQDPPGGRAGRVRRHRGPRDDGGPARGDRRSDLRRVRSPGGPGPAPAGRRCSTEPCRSPSSTPSTGNSLDDTDYTTIGGYVFGQLGRLPRPGDRVKAGAHALEVVEMEGRRVKSLRLHPAEPDTQREAESPVAGRESRAS